MSMVSHMPHTPPLPKAPPTPPHPPTLAAALRDPCTDSPMPIQACRLYADPSRHCRSGVSLSRHRRSSRPTPSAIREYAMNLHHTRRAPHKVQGVDRRGWDRAAQLWCDVAQGGE
jgi:hypothetical protein